MRATKAAAAALFSAALAALVACGGGGDASSSTSDTAAPPALSFPAIRAAFPTSINPDALANYAAQPVPAYITRDLGAVSSNAKATLGRVLFYDRKLSIDDTASCASCHQQAQAFGDAALGSAGVQGGTTARQSMRLVNARFGAEAKFFWDERAATLEQQTTRPIQDHNEMGFSGQSGRPALSALLSKLAAVGYYTELFTLAFGDAAITEARLQEALGQFVRSIQSFDTKFDTGRAAAASDAAAFANYTAQENQGKQLFLNPPVFDATGNRTSGGLGCAGCHRPPEFAIDPASGNNAIIGTLAGTGFDQTVTRAPSLREFLSAATGQPHTPLMHTGVITTVQAAVGHYGNINANPANLGLDARLKPGGFGQQLHLTAPEVQAVIAFLRTLTGTAVYTDARWSDPFTR